MLEEYLPDPTFNPVDSRLNESSPFGADIPAFPPASETAKK